VNDEQLKAAAYRLIASQYDQENGEFLVTPDGKRYSRSLDGYYVGRAVAELLSRLAVTSADLSRAVSDRAKLREAAEKGVRLLSNPVQDFSDEVADDLRAALADVDGPTEGGE